MPSKSFFHLNRSKRSDSLFHIGRRMGVGVSEILIIILHIIFIVKVAAFPILSCLHEDLADVFLGVVQRINHDF